MLKLPCQISKITEATQENSWTIRLRSEIAVASGKKGISTLYWEAQDEHLHMETRASKFCRLTFILYEIRVLEYSLGDNATME